MTPSKLIRAIKRFQYMYLDVNFFVLLVLFVYVFHQPIADAIVYVFMTIFPFIAKSKFGNDLAINLLSDIVFCLVIAIGLYWFFGIYRKLEYAGKFNAVDIDIKSGEETDWGALQLHFNPISKKMHGTVKHKEIVLNLEGVLEKGKYFRGHYFETGRPIRRRCGAFLMVIDGEGENYNGYYVYVDPDKDHYKPTSGKARWERCD